MPYYRRPMQAQSLYVFVGLKLRLSPKSGLGPLMEYHVLWEVRTRTWKSTLWSRVARTLAFL